MEGDYHYQPLNDPGNIRLLIVEPANSLTAPLICDLEEVEPNNASYIALSYSWAMEDDQLIPDRLSRNVDDDHYETTHAPGNSVPTKPIVLGGVDILVGENLRDALRRLREKSKMPARLWVDAVCINQRDNVEKSNQVAKMAAIYRNASTVAAWLGEGEESVNAAAYIAFRCLLAEAAENGGEAGKIKLDYIPAVHQWCTHTNQPDDPHHYMPWNYTMRTCRVCCEAGFPSAALPFESRRTAFAKTLGNIYYTSSPIRAIGRVFKALLPSGILYGAISRWHIAGTDTHCVPPYTALVMLSRRRYFQRRWIVQEVAVQKSDRVAFLWGSQWTRGNLLNLLYALGIDISECQYWWPDRLLPDTATSHGSESTLDLYRWMEYCNGRLCADPRDRLYAVLGCLPQLTDINPDYTQSLPSAFAGFAKYFLARRDVCTILYNSSGHNNYGLATWMPDLLRIRKPLIGRVDQELYWQYISPSLSEDGLVLSCHLMYRGTLTTPPKEMGAGERRYGFTWQADDSSCVHPLSVGEFADSDVENVTPGEIVGYWKSSELLKVGDVLCTIPQEHWNPVGFWVVLRSAQRPYSWEVIEKLESSSSRLQYAKSSKPRERRLYHLV